MHFVLFLCVCVCEFCELKLRISECQEAKYLKRLIYEYDRIIIKKMFPVNFLIYILIKYMIITFCCNHIIFQELILTSFCYQVGIAWNMLCSLQKGKTPLPHKKMECLVLKLNCICWWGSSSGECGVFFHYHYTQVHWAEVVLLVRVTSMGQIDLRKHYLYSIRPFAKKKKTPKNYEETTTPKIFMNSIP